MVDVVNISVDYTTGCCSDFPLALHTGVYKNILEYTITCCHVCSM